MALGLLQTVLSCIFSALLASSLTFLLTSNGKSSPSKDEPSQYNLPPPSRRKYAQNISNDGPKKTILPRKNPTLVIVRDAVKQGAVCLDGSPPGYYWKKGEGRGTTKWIIHLSGGAWCYDELACYQRTREYKYGSTYYHSKIVPEEGMYSRNRLTNPHFHNWNMIFVIYCDGASFTGMRSNPVYFGGNAVYFRGKLILRSIINNLLKRGLRHAHDVILTGSSAGSLAVLIHADYIKSFLPARTKVRAVADSGYFVDLKTHYGAYKLRTMFRSVLETHNSTAGLHQSCVRRTPRKNQWKCFFPQYFFSFIRTPVFILQSAYDVWQIISGLQVLCSIPGYHILSAFANISYAGTLRDTRGINSLHARIPRGAQNSVRDPEVCRQTLSSRKTFAKDSVTKLFRGWHWQSLYGSSAECTKSEVQTILNIRNNTLEALKPVLQKKQNGLFLSPCFEHTQAQYDIIWKNVMIRRKTMGQAIHEWYSGKTGNHFYIGEYLSFTTCVP